MDATMSAVVPGMRAPKRVTSLPMYGPAKLGTAVATKIRPAPLEDQSNVSIAYSGRVLDLASVSARCDSGN